MNTDKSKSYIKGPTLDNINSKKITVKIFEKIKLD